MDQPEASNPFQITVKRMEHEPFITYGVSKGNIAENKYQVTFLVQNKDSWPDWQFEISQWVWGDNVAADDVIRAAKHQLLQDFEALVQKAAAFRIPDAEIDDVYRPVPAPVGS